MGNGICCCKISTPIDCIIDSGCCREYHLNHPRGESVDGGGFNGLKRYSFCGPNTDFSERYKQGYRGVNKLDMACMLHDKVYVEGDIAARRKSDLELIDISSKICEDPNADEQMVKDAKKVARWIWWKSFFCL